MKPKPRNIIPNKGGEPFTVHQHIILKNFWEYYLGETDENGVAFGYVMGIANEWGSVDLNEIKPYIIGQARANDLWHIIPPEGYCWEDEKSESESKRLLIAAYGTDKCAKAYGKEIKE